MKRVIIIVLVMIILGVGITLAGQQIRVRTFDSIQWGGDNSYGWIERECSKHCNKMSDNVDSYFKNGWQIVAQRPIIITENPFYKMQYKGYCKCIGVEYILDSGN